MLNIGYQYLNFSRVTNLSDFYKDNLPEMTKVKSLVEGIKLMFSLPQTCVLVDVAEGERVYKITLLEPGIEKIPMGYFVYIPLDRRLDLYQSDNPRYPYIQWKNKKPVYKMYSSFLDRAGLSLLFDKLVNVT